MAKAYTPGLTVSERTTHQVQRILPVAGKVLVEKGNTTKAQEVIAKAELPGDVYPVNLSHALSIPPSDVEECLLISTGTEIRSGDLIAQSKGIFGFFKTDYNAKTSGTLETISEITGQIIIRGAPQPVEILSYLSGKVVDIIPNEGAVVESEVALIQGIFGIGGEAYGNILVTVEKPVDALTPEMITDEMEGKIIIGGARMSYETIQKAIDVKASAIISGGIDDQDMKELLGYDLGVAITGTEKIGTTVIITEGFGDIAMADKTFEIFTKFQNAEASVSGATQIRAGVMRPEILIPLSPDQTKEHSSSIHAGMLEIGRPVRMIRDPYFGKLGKVTDLPTEPHLLASGSKARVLEVEVENGNRIIVPRANIELIEA
jgi:hypothetical protein